MALRLTAQNRVWLGLAAACSFAGAVGLLADEVLEGETQSLDMAVLMSLRANGNPADPLGPAWLEEAARDVTALGSFTILFALVAFVSIFLWLAGRRRNASFLVLATGSGALVSTLMKMVFDRPRPDLTGVARVFTASFPSGHALASAVVYLSIGVFVARAAPTRALSVYALACAVFITLMVGLSRIYLGVHYPTDVLAGWLTGAGWALSCWLAAELWLARRTN